MENKKAVAFANIIFMEEIEKQILNESPHKPLADVIVLLVVITDYKVRSMLHGALEEVVIVKRNM